MYGRTVLRQRRSINHIRRARRLVQLCRRSDPAHMADERPDTGGEVAERTRLETQHPSMWKVLLLNDDYTPMEFVVFLLESIYDKSPAEAYRIMMMVHTQGQGLCGVYPFDVAETRVAKTEELAQDAGYPLKAVMEQE
jgi:ATP-dependent Clp protease adaptor protein ClpS